ncbi:MAG: hypothetical protein KC584_07975 [Nitrospira sp.]|nr:hypothetical protein [Nitrospira sp.]
MPLISTTELKRYRFLAAIAEHAPQVLRDLRESVYPAYRKLFPVEEITKAHLAQARGFMWEDFEANEDSPDEAHQNFIFALGTWAEKYNLIEAWVFSAALPTLAFWLTFECNPQWRLPNKLVWCLSRSISWADGHPPPFAFLADSRFYHFRETMEDEMVELRKNFDQWKEQITKEFEKAMEEYKTSTEDRHKTLLGTDSTRQIKHYKWLVYYQVYMLTPAKIADKFAWEPRAYQRKPSTPLGESTVREAVHELAETIGLTLRPDLERGPK